MKTKVEYSLVSPLAIESSTSPQPIQQAVSSPLQIIRSLLSISLPLCITRLSWVIMKTTDTALIGHTGLSYLTGTALADMWTSSTSVFLSGSVLSTFASTAFGSGTAEGKKLAGKRIIERFWWILRF